MTGESNPLEYRSKGDAVGDDVRTMHRSLRTWVMLWTVWGVGLVVWVGYLAVIAVIVLRLLT